MNTERHVITVSGLQVEVVRKAIKNLHLGVYPPRGRVRVAVPLGMSKGAVRLAVIGRLGWIKRQQAKFAVQPRQSRREMVSGESHYFLGRRYRLRLSEHEGGTGVVLRNNAAMELRVRPHMSPKQRELVLQRWYRRQLRTLVLALLEKWQPIIGVEVAGWGIKRMKTKWGSCNKDARRIWFNLELAKKPVKCLEYIAVHELVHLRERHHDDRFVALMDQFVPRWRLSRDELNGTPLGHDRWQ